MARSPSQIGNGAQNFSALKVFPMTLLKTIITEEAFYNGRGFAKKEDTQNSGLFFSNRLSLLFIYCIVVV